MLLARFDNQEIGDLLDRIADLLEVLDTSRYRVLAYRNAARTVRVSQQPVSEIFGSGGCAALERLPGIGQRIAAQLGECLESGRLSYLEQLEGRVSPEALLSTVPGIGPELARRIHRKLRIDKLEDLELAAHNGRLERVRGIGPRRVRGIRDAVAGILSRSGRLRARGFRRGTGGPRAVERELFAEPRFSQPPVAMLLAVDREYRERDAVGGLRRIAPRRFNQRHEAWLSVLEAEKDGWSFTAMYSNTLRAHELGRTHDWVVIYYERDGDEGQCTIVTERAGRLSGRRVVRGRESECASLYASE